MTKRRTLISVLIVASLFTGMALAVPTAYGETFCGDWDFGNSGQAGESHIWKISQAVSQGDAYAGPEADCDDDDEKNGTYKWTVQHGTINPKSGGGRVGNEHGTFSFTGDSGSKLGGIFNGAIAAYDPPPNCDDTEDEEEDATTKVVYASSGRFNTLKNNERRTGSDSTFHGVGSYLVNVTASNSDGDDKWTCFFESRLTGQQN